VDQSATDRNLIDFTLGGTHDSRHLNVPNLQLQDLANAEPRWKNKLTREESPIAKKSFVSRKRLIKAKKGLEQMRSDPNLEFGRDAFIKSYKPAHVRRRSASSERMSEYEP
jgi:hypothetical protein